MGYFNAVGVLTGVSFDQPVGTVSILTPDGVDSVVQIVDYGTGQTTELGVTPGGLADVGTPHAHGSGRTPLGGEGASESILDTVLEYAVSCATDALTESVSAFTASGGHAGDAVDILALEVAGITYVYVADNDGAGLSTYRLETDGSFTFVNSIEDTLDTYGLGIETMASVSIGKNQFLYTGSALEHGLNVYQIGNDGGLTLVEAIGPEQLLPVQGISQIIPVVIDGRSFLIVAATGTSSLSVLEIAADGSLSVTDHVIDTLDTRFQNVSMVKVFQKDGQTFVLAAGADDGISLFTLLPDGQLVYLDTIVDSTDIGLSNISAMDVVLIGDELQIFVTSGSEAGVTVLSLDLSSVGDMVSGSSGLVQGTEGDDVLVLAGTGELQGGDGDDILYDGAGNNTLSGGAGSDLFVLRADGQTDTIIDFDPGQDHVDFSFWPFFYDISQLEIEYTLDGAVITFRDETLIIHTASGEPLTWADIESMLVDGINRATVTLTTAPPARVSVIGTAHADILEGTVGDDNLEGLAGNDILVGGLGRDHFNGGEGMDIVSFEALTTHVVFNLLDSTQNAAGALGDTSSSIEGVWGTHFADTLIGNDVANHLKGNGGADELRGGGGNDLLEGQLGDDTLYGDRNHDRIYGGYGDDTLYGGYGNDLVRGGGGNDRLEGQLGNDTMFGDRGHDRMYGGNGDDTLYGGYGNDLMRGGGGNDRLYGEVGNDTMFGDRGNDIMYGGDGNDTMYGGYDNDLMYGGDGNDRLAGEQGNDQLDGGLGSDTFVFADGFGIDIISDFDALDDNERIQLSAVTAITDYDDLAANHMTQVGDDVVIDDGAGNTITLTGVSLSDLDANDFIF